jgi:HAD superfamily hydrolase (TIGR01450 family)
VICAAPWRFAGYAMDLDGTVYLGDRLLPGAREAIERLREAGSRIVFVTNKPLSSAAEYAAKLTGLGIATDVADVVTALDALLQYLEEHYPGAAVLPLAEPLVHHVLAERGFRVVDDPSEAEIVAVSFDRTFSYAKLLAAFRAITDHGARIVATNPDPYCPTPEGGLPDCAAMLAAVEACTGRRAEAIVGKPSKHMARAFLQRLGLPPGEVAVVGDRLLTDVQMGQALGMTGVLVLSGATSALELADSGVEPDYVLDGIHQLFPRSANDPENAL